MLKLYENIKALRKLNHWTQEDLAKLMGYNDRSMIAKIEAGKVDITQGKIIQFAKVFGVDPGDLMGLDGIKDQLVNSYVQSSKNQELIELYNNATPEIQDIVDRLLKSAQLHPESSHSEGNTDK